MKDWGIHTDINMLDGQRMPVQVHHYECSDGEGHCSRVMHTRCKDPPTSTKPATLKTARPQPSDEPLAMLGIGIDTSIASANEVEDAIAKQQVWGPSEEVDNPNVQSLARQTRRASRRTSWTRQ